MAVLIQANEPSRRSEPAISFRNDVMAVLAKAGCSAGTCHGNKNGKGGFKLSLRGQDPDFDYESLTHDVFARRTNPLDPEQSLILLKPTTQVAHEGGLRFKKGSAEYEILRKWISDGMANDAASAATLQSIEVSPNEKVLIEPAGQVQLRTLAEFADGTTRDVTSLAVYEPANALATVSPEGLLEKRGFGETTVLVRYLRCQEAARFAFVPQRPSFEWRPPQVHNYVDEHIFGKLRTLRMNPSVLCSDETFLRRAYLDLLGMLPTTDEARAFLNSNAGGELSRTGSNSDETAQRRARRERLIDELLDRQEFADFWALKWADLLRVEAHSLDVKGVQNFHHWIRQSIAENKPLDQFVRELIATRGSTYGSPAANFYRPNRDPATRAKAAAQIFLGTRLQCAECHNHPSDRWTQDDYYDWAGVFARVNYKVLENKREIGSDQHEWNGEQVIFLARKGSLRNPRSGQDAVPRFLGETLSQTSHLSPGAESNFGMDTEPLGALAAWITSPNNKLFARVQANRIWFHLLGRGLVDPPDDFRATNPASHPALLDALAEDFVKHRFDLRYLIRLIMNSAAYQLASEPNESNEGDSVNYSHTLIRRLSAEQMLDSQSRVMEVPLRFAGFPVGLRAAQLPGVRPESKNKRRANQLDQFLEMFGKPPRLLTTDSERSCECNMSQAFQMISGLTMNDFLSEKSNRVSRLLSENKSNSEILDELFWAALTRSATATERREFLSNVESASDRRKEFEDILWGILNSKEFLFRR